jgi:hypothetical protein
MVSVKQLTAAVLVLLGAVYLKCTLPVFVQEGIPALHHMLAQEQVMVTLPPEWMSWLGLS